ncbi:MacB-like periplasmic core domain protein (plasmid) [Gemmatirosa kalamazoonensis]|uniref:MacB-like periplasmic core domain protein n=1 Tax=Gemmatirosa kalamazoonensis TaxID=861299 RepID=W0RS46_9BACT|nr:FtsX-like permease family protein [Gemmatirosa kalamazoonensis]AHG93526.1 MacB-like periplasmic core domain protein [Gemmatirosa kalamazoonensis]
MKFLPLVLANLKRHKLRTVLTTFSVALALFLFASLRTVVTTLNSGSQVMSASRLIVQNSTAFVIPLPMSYAARLKNVPHVQEVTWANWFGGKYGDGKKFFAQFAVDPESYLKMYPEIQVADDQKQAFLKERSAALIGEGLVRAFGWKVGDNVTIQGTIFPGDWTFTIRGIYHPTLKEYGDDSFMFHYDYMYEKYPDRVTPGWYILKIDDPNAAPAVIRTIDDGFRNSAAPTKTGTEKAFAAGFASMWGNVKLLMSTIGMAVVFAILLVTANAMMMNQRERRAEVAVMKTVGFSDRRVFGLVIVEAAVISLVGAVLGLGGAVLLPAATGFGNGGFLPGFHVTPGTLAVGATVALLLTVASGIFPAWQAAKLPVVQALRRVE